MIGFITLYKMVYYSNFIHSLEFVTIISSSWLIQEAHIKILKSKKLYEWKLKCKAKKISRLIDVWECSFIKILSPIEGCYFVSIGMWAHEPRIPHTYVIGVYAIETIYNYRVYMLQIPIL